ncbi:MAG: RNA 2'-phosphotransferase [Tissierellia bacterium]|nr:RNA 2'-phosphotransferase [Tissierellia bacterium]
MNKKLSKTLSYLLRHCPKDYHLSFDDEGWVEITSLVNALRKRGWENLQKKDLFTLTQGDKKRFEIKNNKIRGIYGHSLEKKIKKNKCAPPPILYHGTTRAAYEKIKKEGLKPMDRQYVHLNKDILSALEVGRRRDFSPVVLEINVFGAMESQVHFYLGEEGTWLSDSIPPKWIKISYKF